MKTIFILGITVVLFTACEENPESTSSSESDTTSFSAEPVNPLAKDNRIYGINISESINGFEASFQKAKEAGIDVVELNIPWKAIEPSKGNYIDPWQGVLAATAYYGNEGIKVSFSIAVINTVAWEVPSGLENMKANHPDFIAAFNSMLDWFMQAVPENVEMAYLSIGNEIDLVLQGNEAWEEYTRFYKAVTEHIDTKYPHLTVGVKTTVMGGLFSSEEQEIKNINQFSDVVMLNYYPQNEFFEVKDPKSVHSDFKKMVEIFPDKTIYMTEIGYQSGNNYCKSNKAKQAEFYHEMFTAWDANKDNIKLIAIDWLHDQSTAQIEEWKSYYGDHPALVEYLSTLGLRTYQGEDKPAYKQVKREALARGW